ncbi:MAG: hypothetical protein HYV27_06575 [Candidatus Hydrogenedentes bacterium]|nr:hypothetical protein [Candidatus Hydrogenedentota bacterium]
MVNASQTGCINHPTVQAVARCKQCSRPVCNSCIVPGPTGRFCSPVCKEKHEHFLRQASQMDSKARGALFIKLKSLLTSILIAAAVGGVILFIATRVEIPVLTDIANRIRDLIGI